MLRMIDRLQIYKNYLNEKQNKNRNKTNQGI